ncbi:MAG TPA: glycosyltransferase [Miltoncostaeaceae bacterium]|nr:glycosyltransferase [Miltoncostaeaceae bacterium]
MDAPPELSVVISTRGTPAVAETVESVTSSADAVGKRVEVLVAWAGADDPPGLGEGVRVLRVFPAGLVYSRNRGLQAAAAPLVAFVDDDELVDAGWVAALLAAFAREPSAAGVFGPVAPRDERGLAYCRHDAGGEPRVFGAGTVPWKVGTGGNMAFRRAALLGAGGFDPFFGLGSVSRSAEETELILRLFQAGHVLAWSPEAVVYHPTKTEEERLDSRFPYAFGLGKLARRHRDPALAARYGREIAGALVSGARAKDRRRVRETSETLRGYLTGLALRSRPESPLAALDRLPGAVSAALDGANPIPCEPTFRPEPHFAYLVGGDRILHAYVNPPPRLPEALQLRGDLGMPGVPTTFALAAGEDALWVLEERLPGRAPRPDAVTQWFGPVAEWALQLEPHEDGKVHEGSWWADEAGAAIAVAPASLRSPVESALDEIGDLPGRPLHGDFQRKNVLLGGERRVGVLDWEHAYRDGPPGLDLLFLALMAGSDRPDPDVISALARGSEPEWAPLRSYLARGGIDDPQLPSLLLAALAVWAADEQARAAVPGMPRAEPLYLPLLRELAPGLARA